MSSETGKREFEFSGVKSIPIHEGTNIPSCVFYMDRGVKIGEPAITAAKPNYHLINRDFKVDLGMHAPERVTGKSRFGCADGQSRTAGQLAADFIHELFQNVDSWLRTNQLVRQPFILVAEPVALEAATVTKDWGDNYRDYVRRSLRGKGFTDIDFCPEPFAVYNYYRYEKQVALLKERAKQRVLVIDFGAGTLDASIIETTLKGEIAISGEKLKPLAVSSDAIGGYLFNRLLVEYKYRQLLGKTLNANISKGVDLYNRWRKEGDRILETAAANYRAFCHYFHESTYKVEEAKIHLCDANLDWEPDSKLNPLSEDVMFPRNPFTEGSDSITTGVSIGDVRQVFVGQLWPQRIRPMIRKCLDRAKVELEGEPINIILLSGGSSNLRWLRPLLQHEFEHELLGAPIVSLYDYQEVVAKGLAIECARRFYGRIKDLCQVTYNPLYLFVDCDGTGIQGKTFTPRQTSGLPKPERTGLLLPSGTPVQTAEGTADSQSLRWKVRLDREPRHRLDYFFYRSYEERTDSVNALNLGSTTLTPCGECRSDSKLQFELVRAGDKSVIPRFYFQSRQDTRESVYVDGAPFYLDLASAQQTSRGAYIGFDFGTCNSSLAYVDDRQIRTVNAHAGDPNWRDLRKLRDLLPYPIAEPLARYCAEDDDFRKAELMREALEGALTFTAFLCYFDFCLISRNKSTSRLRELRQRSAGPLWKMVRELAKALGTHALLSKEFQTLLRPEIFERVDALVTYAAQQKHQKAGEMNADRPLEMIANACARASSRFALGHFESVKPVPLSRGKLYEGQFKVAHGNPPYSRVFRYRGDHGFSRDEVYILDVENWRLLCLSPLLFWMPCDEHSGAAYGAGHLYMFDKYDDRTRGYSFKAVGHPCTMLITGDEPFVAIHSEISAMFKEDPQLTFIETSKFESVQM